MPDWPMQSFDPREYPTGDAHELVLLTPEWAWLRELTPGGREALGAELNYASCYASGWMHMLQMRPSVRMMLPNTWDKKTQRYTAFHGQEWTEYSRATLALCQSDTLNKSHTQYLDNLHGEAYYMAREVKTHTETLMLAGRVNAYRERYELLWTQPKKMLALALKRTAQESGSMEEAALWRKIVVIGTQHSKWKWDYNLPQWVGQHPDMLRGPGSPDTPSLRHRLPINLGQRYYEVWYDWNKYLWSMYPQSQPSKAMCDYGPMALYPHPLHALIHPTWALHSLRLRLAEVLDGE